MRLLNRTFAATLVLSGCLAATTIQCEVPDIRIVGDGFSHYRHSDTFIIEDDCCCCDDDWFDWWW